MAGSAPDSPPVPPGYDDAVAQDAAPLPPDYVSAAIQDAGEEQLGIPTMAAHPNMIATTQQGVPMVAHYPVQGQSGVYPPGAVIMVPSHAAGQYPGANQYPPAGAMIAVPSQQHAINAGQQNNEPMQVNVTIQMEETEKEVLKEEKHEPPTPPPAAPVVIYPPNQPPERVPSEESVAPVRREREVIFEGRPNCAAAMGAWCGKRSYLITTDFIEIEHGICCKEIDNLQLIRIQDLRYTGCCCCHCGTITVISSDKTTPHLYLKGIPNGRMVFMRLRDAFTDRQSNAKLELDM